MPQAIGSNIDIGGLSKAIQEADNGLKNLQKTSDNVTKSINKAFESVAQGGVQQLSQTIEALNKRLQNLGNISSSKSVSNMMDGIGKSTENAIDKVNRLSRQMEGLVSGNMSNNAGTLGKLALGEQLQKVDQELNQAIARYKELQNEFTHLSVPAGNNSAMKAIQDEVQFVIEYRKLLETEKDAILKAQASLENAQKTLSRKDPFKAKIDDLGRESLEAMRYKDAMDAMREFYAEEEKRARESEKNRQKYLNTPKGAMEFAQKAMNEERSIKALKEAISHLEKAQESVNTRTQKGKKEFEQLGNQLRQTKKALSELTGESKDFSASFKGVGNTIAAAFSIHSIRGFVNQLIAIRGEFELQHRSLQILIGDLDKANEIWDKTVSLAVKSPFRVKELVTYTKQLAAYRVEADKLYETNRMLADVSAGLGVDMNRLILAFGQVKAANFLRGTELRQFSEAGVNMLDELAKRFTALEGRVVSVGEVFERVSKRMVSFKDVEAVFETITSKGGVFYQMQEKQAETTRGMIMNLKDSIDLMFNEIGQTNDGIIKGSIRLIKQLIDNWRRFKPVIETTGIALLTYFGTKALKKIANGVNATITAFNTHPIVAVISLVATLATIIWRCVENTDALTAALNQIDIEVTKQLQESISLYRELAEKIQDVTTKEEDRTEAMTELESKFKDILPDQYLELEYIRSISDNYDAATDAMMNYYNSKAMQQKKDKVESEFSDEIYGTDIPELIESLQTFVTNTESLTDRQRAAVGSGVSGIVNKIVEEIKSGELENSYDTVLEELNKRLAKYGKTEALNVDIKDWWGFTQNYVAEDIRDLVKTLDEYSSRMSYIPPLPYASWDEEVAANALIEYKNYIKQVEGASNQLFNLADKFSKSPEGRDATEQIMAIVESLDLPDNLTNQFQPLLLEYANELFLGAKGGELEFKALSASVQEKWKATIALIWSSLAENTASSAEVGAKELADLMWKESDKAVAESAGLQLSDFQKEVANVFRDVAKDAKVDNALFAEFIPDSTKAVGDIIKDLKKLEEERTEAVKAWDKVISRGASIEEAEAIRTISNDTIEAWRKSIPVLAEAADRLGYVPKKENKDKNKDIQERIKVVDDMHKKYEELNKTLSESESLEGAFKAYKDAFATAYGREDVRKMSGKEFVKKVLNFPNEDEVVKWFDDLEKQVSDKKDKMKVSLAKGKFVMDATVRLKKDTDKQLEKDIQDLFDEYDLSRELKKLNIPTDLAKSLFGIKTTDLKDIRKKIEDELTTARAEKGNEDRIKQLEEDLEKVNDMEDKAQIERLKTYLQYTRDAIGERAKIKVEEMTKLQEIDETFTKAMNKAKTEEDKKRIKEQRALAEDGVRKEASEKTNKLDWEDFKSSDTFINLFNDLDNASTELITHTITQIEKFKKEWTDMPVESAKEMALKLNDLQLALMDTDKPLKDNKKLWAELGNEMEKRGIEGRTRSSQAQAKLTEAVTSENKDFEEEIALGEKRIAMLEVINNITSENKETKLQELGVTKDTVTALGLSEKVLSNSVKKNQDLIKGEEDSLAKINDKIAANRKVLNTQKQISKNYQELNDAISTAKKLANDLYDSFKELTEVLGGDGPAMIFADMGMSMANTVLDTIMLIVQMNAATIAAEGLGAAMKSASGIIGWIVMAIEILVQAIAAAFNYAEKVKQMKLDILAGQVDNLKQKFDALAESIDEAWSIKQLKEYEREIDKVHDKMKAAQEDYIKLLESNDKDKDTIEMAKEAQTLLDAGYGVEDLTKKQRKALLSEEYKNYKEATDDLAEIEEDYADKKKEILESVGGITDPHDAASEFVDAWLDAYKETGDGLAGLEDNFDEFFENLIKQKAARMLSDTLLTQWIDAVNGALAEDSEGGRDLTDSEKADIKAAQERAKGEINSLLTGLFDGLGVGTGNGELSSLQKGVQGVTEQTAQVLEALLNSMRDTQANAYSELQSQTNILRDIKGILNDLTSAGPRALSVKFA